MSPVAIPNLSEFVVRSIPAGHPSHLNPPPVKLTTNPCGKVRSHLYLSILGFNHDISRLTGWKTCKNGLNEFLDTVIETQDTFIKNHSKELLACIILDVKWLQVGPVNVRPDKREGFLSTLFASNEIGYLTSLCGLPFRDCTLTFNFETSFDTVTLSLYFHGCQVCPADAGPNVPLISLEFLVLTFPKVEKYVALNDNSLARNANIFRSLGNSKNLNLYSVLFMLKVFFSISTISMKRNLAYLCTGTGLSEQLAPKNKKNFTTT